MLTSPALSSADAGELSLPASAPQAAADTATKDQATPVFDRVPLPPRKKIKLPHRQIKSASAGDAALYQPVTVQ